MSQVKKLQTGGNTPTGKFRMNGREISGQTAIDRLSAVYSGLPLDEREMFTVAQKAIQDGNTAEYDPTNNTIRVFGSTGNDITRSYTNTKASTEDSNLKRTWGAIFNNEAHRFKKSGEAMAMVDMSDPKAVEEATAALMALRRGYGFFDYDDKDGTLTYRKEGPSNLDRMKIIDEFAEYIRRPEEETKKTYTTNGWSAKDLTALRNALSGVDNTYWEGLKDRIINNTLSASDLETLRLMGFEKDSAGAASADGGDVKLSIPEGWKGDAGAAAGSGIGIRRGSDGNYYVYGDPKWTSGTYYLGDYDWAANTDFANGILHNGRLFTEAEVFNDGDVYNTGEHYAMRQAVSPFIQAWSNPNLSWNDRWQAALNSGVHWANEGNNIFANNINPENSYIENWSKYFRDNNLNASDYSLLDASNMFDNIGNNQVIAYINNDKQNRNRYGIDNVKYLVRNGSGNIVQYNNLDALTSGAGLVTNKSVFGIAPRDLNVNPYKTIGKGDFATYKEFSTGNQKNTLFIGRDGYLYWARRDQSNNLMEPKKVYDVETMEDILANPESYAKDINKWYSKITQKPVNPTWGATPLKWRFKQNKSNWRQLQEGLPTYQWGGAIQSVKNNIIEKNVDDAKTDVSNMHAVDMTEGGLTDAEKTLIGAAIGDLTGVGLTFAGPAGNVAGVATGAAASLARHAANKEMGVKNATGKLVADLALDAATIIPILGTGTKSLKAANAIRVAAEPILKMLAITGAAEPVVTAVKRIASGDKYTSADLARAIQGVGSAAIATRLIKNKIGDVKLAKETNAVAINETNSISRNGVTKTADEVAAAINGKTKEEATKALGELFKNKDTNLPDTKAAELLNNLGVSMKKGKIESWGPKDWGKNLTGRGRGSKTVKYKPAEETSGLRYWLDPLKREKTLSNLGDMRTAIWNAAAADRPTLAQQSLLRRTAQTPWAFGDLFKTQEGYTPVSRIASTWRRPYLGGGRYYRISARTDASRLLSQNAASLVQISTATPIVEPVILPSGPRTQSRLALPTAQSQLLLPKHISTMPTIYGEGFLTGYRPVQYGPDNNFILFRKKGGKIIKAQQGVTLQKLNYDFTDPFLKPKTPTIVRTPSKINVGTSANNGVGNTGGFIGNKPLVNWPNVDDILRGAVTASSIYKDRDIQRDALKYLKMRQFQTPQIDKIRYNFSDIEQGYEGQRRPLLESRYVTSDSRDDLAFKLNRAQQLSNLETQKNAAISQRMTAIDDQNRQIESTNEAQRVNTANQKSQYLTGLEYQDRMLDSQALNALHAQVINPLGQQFSQQGRDAFNKRLDTQYKLDIEDATKLEDNRISTALRNQGFIDKWNALTTAEKANYSDIGDYVYSLDPEAYKNIYIKSPGYRRAIQNAVDRYTNASGARVFYSKSGGKIRDAQEQIAIDSNREAKKALAKLSDNLMRMLQQLTK